MGDIAALVAAAATGLIGLATAPWPRERKARIAVAYCIALLLALPFAGYLMFSTAWN